MIFYVNEDVFFNHVVVRKIIASMCPPMTAVIVSVKYDGRHPIGTLVTADLNAFTRDSTSFGRLTDDGRAVYGRSVQESVRYAIFGVGLQRIVRRSGRASLKCTPRRLSPCQRRTVPLKAHENSSGPIATCVRGPVYDGGSVMHYLKATHFAFLSVVICIFYVYSVF